ncbi:MAG: MFS transporter [Clostridium sp.]|nr:MFS transporter [Clostridium sp.]
MNKLWTRDFKIITIGSIISMLGNSVAGFAVGLLVLDFTQSTLLYALFIVTYNIPKIVVPLFAGPYLDRFSRKKVIYVMDFLSSGVFFFMFLLLRANWFNYPFFLLIVLFIGTIDGIYTVAYESFYPNLVSKGNFSKAYSISSMIYPLAAFMVPVASFVYNLSGSAAPLFAFNSVVFFIAAVFETKIKHKEKHIDENINNDTNKGFNFIQYKTDFKEGLSYIFNEKGLLVITVYFSITMFAGGGAQTLLLPFFKNNPELFSNIPINVVTLFTIVTSFGVLGRLIGGAIHYKYKYPIDKKFTIAIFVYISISLLEGFQLYFPIPLMIISFFLIGIMGVTSFNIRISATQSYVPDNKRGRFNGTFQMIVSAGNILGQLSAGILGEFIPERQIITFFMTLNILAAILIMYRKREPVKKIYNRSV